MSFEESMLGATRRVQLVRFEACAGCGGAGEVAFAPRAVPPLRRLRAACAAAAAT